MATLAVAGWETRSRRRLRTPEAPVLVGALIAALGCVLFLTLDLHGPDLVAQVARAGTANQAGSLWWSGWYGGVDLPPYSVVSGPLMHLLGVQVAGILAALLASAAAGVLASRARYAKTTAGLAAAAAVFNLFSGRVTFGLGMAAALWCTVALSRRRPFVAAPLALATGLLSPLAALSLGLGAIAFSRGGTGRWRWLPAGDVLVSVASAAVPIVTVSLVFRQPSVMPFDLTDLIPALAVFAATMIVIAPGNLRRAVLVANLVMLAAYAVPSPIGVNATRELMLGCPAIVAACARGKWRMFVGILAVSVWPVANTIGDLVSGSGPSADEAYYTPLLAHLPKGPGAGRVEVVDPATHGADEYVAAAVPLARGWERQIDVADNPLFYASTLSAADYRAWLDRMAVGWVALPTASLDYGSRTEGDLVSAGLPYLHLTWQDASWRLYKVVNPAPLVDAPGSLVSVSQAGLTLHVDEAATVLVKVRWSPVLDVTTPDGERVPGVAQGTADGSATLLALPAAGTYSLGARGLLPF